MGDAILYPTPAKNVLNINPSYNLKPDYRIINILGQVVSKGSINKNTIDIRFLEKGTYFIELSDDDETFIERFIKY